MAAVALNEWVAIGALGCTIVSGLVAALAYSNRVSYKFGKQDAKHLQMEEDMTKVEGRLDKAEQKYGSIDVLVSQMTDMKGRLEDIHHDVRNLLSGKITPASRRTPRD